MICPVCGDELIVTDQDQPVHLEHVIDLREEVARLNGVIAGLTNPEGVAELAESYDDHVERHAHGPGAPGNSREQEFTDQDGLD